jgi:hypothetical protein
MRRGLVIAGLVIAMAVLGAVACSPANVAGLPADAGALGDGELAAPDAGDGGVSADRACADGAFARCSLFQSCSTSALQFRFGDLRTCETLLKENCLQLSLAPSTGTTTASVEACAQDLSGPSSKWSCGDYLFNQNPPPACQQPTGALATGSPCGVGPQCQSGFCSVAAGRMCGTCAPAPQPGDSCANLATCGNTLNCISASLTCEGYVQMGGACTPGLPCGAGQACVGYNIQTGASGTCQPEGTTTGAACSFAGAGCDVFAGLSCNAQTQTCATAQIVGPGQACGLVANQEAYCASSGACVAGVCQASAGVGAACDVVKGPYCVMVTRCIVDNDGGTSGTCQIPSGTACR